MPYPHTASIPLVTPRRPHATGRRSNVRTPHANGRRCSTHAANQRKAWNLNKFTTAETMALYFHAVHTQLIGAKRGYLIILLLQKLSHSTSSRSFSTNRREARGYLIILLLQIIALYFQVVYTQPISATRRVLTLLLLQKRFVL